MYGAKIDNLIKMKNAGINVPEFNVISSRDEIDFSLFDKDQLYAVRSSCSIEDGTTASFAGQFDTYLNVSFDDLEANINKCFDSVSSESINEYSKANNIPLDDIKMNVIVQKMVPSEVSGVFFTANPNGILNESVITAGRGFGEGIVSDKVDTTSYYYSLTDKVYYYEGKEDLLDCGIIEDIIDTGSKIKNILGEYLDIEFAICQDKVYILQARPITTLNTDDPLILDNSNIVESYPGISLPLTVSFVDLVYSGVFRGVCRRVLKNDKELNKHSDVFLNMTGHANGRVYYKISNWYTVLKFLPLNKKIIPVWQEMLGVKYKSYDHDDVKVPWHVRTGTYFNSVYELLGVPKNMKKLNDIFIEVNDDFYDRFDPSLSPVELKALFNEVKVKLFDVWDVTLLNDMYSFIFTGLLKSRMRKKGKTDKEINSLISGISDIESMKPIRAMLELAINKDRMTDEEYAEAKKAYIKLYGDRNLEELKLESRTFRSTPKLLDDRIESYRADMNKLLSTYESISNRKDTNNEKGFIAKRCSLGIANREISRLNRSRIYGIVRLIVDALGDHYVKDGIIRNSEDIYYLTIDEVLDLADNPKVMTDEVEERKGRYEIFRRLPAYSRLIFAGDEFDKSHASVNSYVRSTSGDELIGTPCSGGVAEGEALVIKSVDDTYDVKDKILITKMTDPGWVFLLASAKGVVSEKGSLLSHTAIISRELKIPSVVGVSDLLTTVNTGDIIRMDGDSGTIKIVRRKAT